MTNGDTIKLIEKFLNDTEGKMPSGMPKSHTYIMIAIKQVHNALTIKIDGLEEGLEERDKEYQELHKVVYGTKDQEVEGLVHVGKEFRKFKARYEKIVWALVLAFVGSAGVYAAYRIGLAPP